MQGRGGAASRMPCKKLLMGNHLDECSCEISCVRRTHEIRPRKVKSWPQEEKSVYKFIHYTKRNEETCRGEGKPGHTSAQFGFFEMVPWMIWTKL